MSGQMRYLLIVLMTFLPSFAMAQEGGGGLKSECAAVLAAPPFVGILIRNEGKDFRELSPLKNGRALLGLECSVDELTEFFEDAGWEFLGYEKRNLVGPLRGPSDANPKYFVDASAFFCQKRPTLFGMFGFRCRPSATISFHDGKISNLIVYVSK